MRSEKMLGKRFHAFVVEANEDGTYQPSCKTTWETKLNRW